jgi:hypothetical protein
MRKKVILWMPALILLMSTASVKAQVRIGGLEDPNESAVLDLNATNTTNNGTLGLALPRVALTSTGNYAPLKTHVAGMTVYNTVTTDDVTPGTYYNDGSKWIRIGSGTLINEVDGIIGNEVTDATPGGGLERAGSGSDDSPYTLGIANNGVTAARINDGAVTAAKLNDMSATAGKALVYNGSAWAPASLSTSASCTGAIVYGGAYNGPVTDTYTTGMDAGFEVNWSNPVFSIQGKDLCWATGDISEKKTWTDAKDACADLTTDDRLWRLPNLKELQVLYEAIGGKGGSTTALTALDTYGYGVSNGASAMQSDSYSYWSSTELSSEGVYGFYFGNGRRNFNAKTHNLYVRCVRTL